MAKNLQYVAVSKTAYTKLLSLLEVIMKNPNDLPKLTSEIKTVIEFLKDSEC